MTHDKKPKRKMITSYNYIVGSESKLVRRLVCTCIEGGIFYLLRRPILGSALNNKIISKINWWSGLIANDCFKAIFTIFYGLCMQAAKMEMDQDGQFRNNELWCNLWFWPIRDGEIIFWMGAFGFPVINGKEMNWNVVNWKTYFNQSKGLVP